MQKYIRFWWPKAERKERTKAEVDEIICWLTGYSIEQLEHQIEEGISYEMFFAEAPQINPNCNKIKGSVCGIKVEQMEDSLMQKIRWLDKLVDELAKGKAMEKNIKMKNRKSIDESNTRHFQSIACV